MRHLPRTPFGISAGELPLMGAPDRPRSPGRPAAVVLRTGAATGRAATGAVVISDEERRALERLLRARRVGQALALRARIVLLVAAGTSDAAVAGRLGVTPQTVAKWRRRYARARLDGLCDRPRSGKPRTITDERIADLIDRTLAKPPPGAKRWTVRAMAQATGVSHATVHRLWRAHGLSPDKSQARRRNAASPNLAAHGLVMPAMPRGDAGLGLE